MRHLHHATGILQRTATRCNMLHHSVTYCNRWRPMWQFHTQLGPMWQFHHATGELQHAATCCNMPQHTATRLGTHAASLPCTRYTATHCVTLQHTTPRCNILRHPVATRVASCKTLVLHCNTLQHTATHCNTLHDTNTFFISTSDLYSVLFFFLGFMEVSFVLLFW